MRKYPFVKQESYKDCGATSLLMIIRYYKGDISLEKLFEMTNTSKNGTSAYNIIKAAEKLGFHSYGIKCNIENIKEDKLILPAIAHVIIDNTYTHFLVVYKIDFSKKKILIADPATKLKTISFSEFNEIFTDRMIVMYPIRKILKEQTPTDKYFKNIISTNKKTIIFILILINFSFIISFLSLYILTQSLNSNNIRVLGYAFILMTLKVFLNYLNDHLMIDTNFRITNCLMNESYQNIISLPYRYYRNHTTGDVISRINDMEGTKDFVITYIMVINNIFLVIASAFLLFLLNKQLFIISLVIAILYIINYFMFNGKFIEQLEDLKREKEYINSYMTESIIGFESIKGLNLENQFIQKYQNKNLSYLKNVKNFQKLKIKMNNFKDYLSDISTVLIIGVGLFLVNDGKISFRELMLFYMLFPYFVDPIKNILDCSFILKETKLSLRRILELHLREKRDSKTLETGKIELIGSNIFLEDKKIFGPIQLIILPKDKIIMFGKSGIGKSTFLKTLKQYYESNHIYVNNKDYNSLNFKDKIAYLSQDEYLFTDTLYNNIVLGRKISSNVVKDIIKLCHIDEIIQKDELGMNMLIEENGFNLSGGEKQRIILARSLVGSFEYLFIDEGLSEIDIKLERKILKQLLKTYRDKTIIFVSHRLDNLDLFNKAIKVEEKVEVLEKNEGGS